MPEQGIALSDTCAALDNLIKNTIWQRDEAVESIARHEDCARECHEQVERYSEMLAELTRLRDLAR